MLWSTTGRSAEPHQPDKLPRFDPADLTRGGGLMEEEQVAILARSPDFVPWGPLFLLLRSPPGSPRGSAGIFAVTDS